MTVIAVVLVAGCGSGAATTAGGTTTPAPSGSTPVEAATPAAPGTAKACAGAYHQAPALAAVDVQAPLDLDSAIEGNVGHVEGAVLGVSAAPPVIDPVTQELDGEPRTVEFEVTSVVVTVAVTGTSPGLDDVAIGDDVELRLPYDRQAPGGPSVDTSIDALVEACAGGLTLRAYPTSVVTEDTPSQVVAPVSAVFLSDGGGQLAVMDPFVPTGDPYGIGLLEDLDAAAA